MPIYEYVCAACGPFSQLRKVAEYEQPAQCPECQRQAPRVISAPRLALMEVGNRSAWERNERSAHEPRQSRDGSGELRLAYEREGGAHIAYFPDAAAIAVKLHMMLTQHPRIRGVYCWIMGQEDPRVWGTLRKGLH